jgi:hypothetical protein
MLRKVKFTDGHVQTVTDRYYQKLVEEGKAVLYDLKEEKAEVETKEEKVVKKRQTKSKK